MNRIKVDRNWHGGAEVVFEDRNGFVAQEYLTIDEVEELIGKLQGTWTPEDQARVEFKNLTTYQVSQVADLDGDTQRRELARYELERREKAIKARLDAVIEAR